MHIPERAKTIFLAVLAVVLALAALWSANLVVFHLWAADVPPYYAAWHNKWALWSFVAFLILIASFSLCAYRLWRRSHPST
jgi:hypothetical protein